MKDRETLYYELKQKYLDLYKESEDLYKQNFHIYYDYNYTFGKYYLRRYELFYLTERIGKKIELYQGRIVNGENINVEFIEQFLDEEFSDQIDNIELIKTEYEQAIVFKNIPMMEEKDLRELTEIFVEISSYINPNLSNDEDKKIKRLWKRSVSAYRHNDLIGIRKCKRELDELGIEKPIAKEKQIDYEIMIKKYKDNIEILTSKNVYLINSFPYNQRHILKDQELISKRIKEIKEDIKLLETRLVDLRELMSEFIQTNHKYLC